MITTSSSHCHIPVILTPFEAPRSTKPSYGGFLRIDLYKPLLPLLEDGVPIFKVTEKFLLDGQQKTQAKSAKKNRIRPWFIYVSILVNLMNIAVWPGLVITP